MSIILLYNCRSITFFVSISLLSLYSNILLEEIISFILNVVLGKILELNKVILLVLFRSKKFL